MPGLRRKPYSTDQSPRIGHCPDHWFVTNGAVNPVVGKATMSASLRSVTRLTSAGGDAFYRLKVAKPSVRDMRDSRIHRAVVGFLSQEGESWTGHVVSGLVNAAFGGVARDPSTELDVVIYNQLVQPPVTTNSMAAGTRVTVNVVFEVSSNA